MNENQVKFSSVFKYGMTIFLIFCLVLAGSVLYGVQNQLASLDDINLITFSVALILQSITILLIIISWKKNLELHGIKQITFLESTALVGINSIGKYAPGKIFGSVVRAIAIYKKTGNSQSVIMATFLEQIAMLHSGVAIASILLVLQFYSLPMSLLTTVVFVFSILLIKYAAPCIQWLGKRLNFNYLLSENINELEDLKRYSIIFLLLTLIWISSAWVLYFCIFSFEESANITFSGALLITTLSYLGGFIVLFAPGGIGVREGIMVMLLSPVTGVTLAVAISALHRVITMLFDIVLGGLSLSINNKTLSIQTRDAT